MLTHNNNDNKNNNGFIFGFILGIAAALLLNTKKGRRILKTLVDQGIDRVSNWEDTIKEIIEEDEDLFKADDFVPSTIIDEDKKVIENISDRNENEIKVNTPASEPQPSIVKTATRRFFKGIKKRI